MMFVVQNLLKENVLIFFLVEYHLIELNVNQLINIFLVHNSMFVFVERFLYILNQEDIHQYYIDDNLNQNKKTNFKEKSIEIYHVNESKILIDLMFHQL